MGGASSGVAVEARKVVCASGSLPGVRPGELEPEPAGLVVRRKNGKVTLRGSLEKRVVG